MKLALVEDQVMFRTLLRQLLVEQCGASIVLECGSLGEVRQQIELLRTVDVLLMDIRLPDGDGLSFVEELSAAHEGVVVLLISSSSEDFIVHRVSRSFVQGFVHKDDPPEVLVTAVQVVASGASYFSPRYRKKLIEFGRKSDSFAALLSPREQEMLKLIGAGYSEAEIASIAGVAPATVGTYRYNIMQKLGLHSAAEVQAYALKAGFTTIDELHN